MSSRAMKRSSRAADASTEDEEEEEEENFDARMDQMGLSEARLVPFQSLQSVPNPKSVYFMRQQQAMTEEKQMQRANRSLANRAMEVLSKDSNYTGSSDKAWRDWVWRTVESMIACERAAWGLDYFIFYRLVSQKYLLYEFNTIMLALLSETPVPPDALRQMCVPSLVEADYAPTLADVISLFAVDGENDSTTRGANMVLSVNNCLVPTRSSLVKVHGRHSVEADPFLFFFDGYHETYIFAKTMTQFLERHLGASHESAVQAIDAAITLYAQALLPNAEGYVAQGHTLQICIPRAALRQFVYPCIEYGHPVNLFTERATTGVVPRVHAVPVHSRMQLLSRALPDDTMMEPMALETFLRTPLLSDLQSRIVAHPNLFLKHGAVTNVFHGNPSFDAPQFRARLLELLTPFIEHGLRAGKRLKYEFYS